MGPWAQGPGPRVGLIKEQEQLNNLYIYILYIILIIYIYIDSNQVKTESPLLNSELFDGLMCIALRILHKSLNLSALRSIDSICFELIG